MDKCICVDVDFFQVVIHTPNTYVTEVKFWLLKYFLSSKYLFIIFRLYLVA